MTIPTMHSLTETSDLIRQGHILLLAGEEDLLSQLPEGKWVGGTAANFMSDKGGIESREMIFVTDLTHLVDDVLIKRYDAGDLPHIGADYPNNGFSVVIIPGMSALHSGFAKEVQDYSGIFNAPLIGWISGVPVAEIGKRTPKVFVGNGAPLDNSAAVLHAKLPEGTAAKIDIVNLFEQGAGGEIEFDEEGFEAQGLCKIDGEPRNLAAYINEQGIDTKLPLVANYNGAMINVSVQSVDTAAGKVYFYAPVFPGITYRFAKPVTDYINAFSDEVGSGEMGRVAFSCNCILNYLYADLQGKQTGALVGPITFGEVAYMLLNQTLVYLTVQKV